MFFNIKEFLSFIKISKNTTIQSGSMLEDEHFTES